MDREATIREQLDRVNELLAEFGYVEGQPDGPDSWEDGENIAINMIPSFLKERDRLVAALNAIPVHSCEHPSDPPLRIDIP